MSAAFGAALVGVALSLGGCSQTADDPPAISLVADFGSAEVGGSPAVRLEHPRLEWRFDGESTLTPKNDFGETVGWSVLNDIRNLGVRDGLLRGKAGETPVLTVAIPEHAFPKDRLWAIELNGLAGRRVTVSLSLAAEDEGRIGFWGSPAIRHRGARPAVSEPTKARAALSPAGAPRGVILIVADTLRSDHLDAWGYDRSTAPTLAAGSSSGTSSCAMTARSSSSSTTETTPSTSSTSSTGAAAGETPALPK